MCDPVRVRHPGPSGQRERPERNEPDYGRGFLSELLLALRRGDTAAAVAVAAEEARRRRGPMPMAEASQLALALFSLGRAAEGLAAIARGQPGGYELWVYLGFPEWDRFRGESWFRPLVKRSAPPGAPPLPEVRSSR